MSMMQRFALLALLLAAPLLGSPITYTLTGTASGTYIPTTGDALPFAGNFIWTGVQRTDLGYGYNSEYGAWVVFLSPFSITINGAGAYTNDLGYLFEFPADRSVVIGTNTVSIPAGSLLITPWAGGFLLTTGGAATGWELNSPLGPIPVENLNFLYSSPPPITEMSVNGGALTFDSLADLQFRAEGGGVPEPATWMLVGLGAAALALCRAKRV